MAAGDIMAFVSKTSKYVFDPEREFLLKLTSFKGKATTEEFWSLYWENRFFIKPEMSHFKIAFGEAEGTAYYNLTVSVIRLLQDALWEYYEYQSEPEAQIDALESILAKIRYGADDDDDGSDTENPEWNEEEIEAELNAWNELAQNDPKRNELDAKCRERYEKVIRHINNPNLADRISPERVNLTGGYSISFDVETQVDDSGNLYNVRVKREPFEFLKQLIIRDVFKDDIKPQISLISNNTAETDFPRKAYEEPPVSKDDLLIFRDKENPNSWIETGVNLNKYILEAYAHNRPDIIEYIYDLMQEMDDITISMSGTDRFNSDRMYCPKMFCAVPEEDYEKWRNGEMYFCAALNFRKKQSPLATKKIIIETFRDEIDYDTNTFGGWWTIKYNYGIYTYQEFYDIFHRALRNAVTVDSQQIMPDGEKIRIVGWIAPDDFEEHFKEEFGIEDE